MTANSKIIEQMRDRQARVFRMALDPQRYGLTLKMISADSGIGYDSLRNYAAGETIMPITAIDCLIDVIPDELLSLLFSSGRVIIKIPENINHDDIATWADSYTAKKIAAHRQDSECEERIGPTEKAELDAMVVQFPHAVGC